MAQNRPRRRRQESEEKKEFQEEVLQIDRVTRVVKGGRRLRFRATVVIGDLRGRVGLGIGKSSEVVGAIRKGIAKAKKNLCIIPIYNGTIPHEIKMKYKSSKIILLPASMGTGLIAGGSARKILELAGVKNIISKAMGSSNRINNAKATIKALKNLRKLLGRPTDNEKAASAAPKPPITASAIVIPDSTHGVLQPFGTTQHSSGQAPQSAAPVIPDRKQSAPDQESLGSTVILSEALPAGRQAQSGEAKDRKGV